MQRVLTRAAQITVGLFVIACTAPLVAALIVVEWVDNRRGDGVK